jgi:hypothetical protein
MKTHIIRRFGCFAVVVATCTVFFAVDASAAPISVLIRVPARSTLPAVLPGLLAQWRQSGHVANVLFLTQGRPEKVEHADAVASFESLAVLEFTSETRYAAWQKEDAPALPTGLIVHRADVLAHGELTPRDSTRSVFAVNTYRPLVSAARFDEFVQGYVQPLYRDMRATKYLVRYTAYLERGETGKVDAINVLEYRDSAAFDTLIGTLKNGIRENLLATHPTYPKYDKIKDTIRVDGFGTFATYTELPPR